MFYEHITTASPYSDSTKLCMEFRFLVIFKITISFFVNVRGKAAPLQAWSGLEDSRKLRFPDFMPTAQDGGKALSPSHRPPLPPRNEPGNHLC